MLGDFGFGVVTEFGEGDTFRFPVSSASFEAGAERVDKFINCVDKHTFFVGAGFVLFDVGD